MARLLNISLVAMLAVSLAFGMTACKSQKKLAKEKAAAEYAASLEKARQDLLDILNENTTMTLADKEARVNEIKGKNFNDPEIDELIRQAEEKLAKERTELNKKEMEAKRKQEEVKMRKEMTTITLSDYFNSIANAGSTSEANMFINDALGLFNSPDTPVLIIISKSGDINDYDRPTTIKNYLNYLKDTKNNINKVDKITYDNNGKIKELELLKMK
jgi:hypothetical protein